MTAARGHQVGGRRKENNNAVLCSGISVNRDRAVFGFGGVAVMSAGIAKILFFIFIVLFVVSLITHMSRRV
jgi:uncharacterized membrane protein YtjA (UPF0391 family)